MKRIVLAVAAGLCMSAFARQGVPVADFVAVPIQSTKPLTASQVRKAVLHASAIEHWDVEAEEAGAMTLRAIKDLSYTITVRVKYTATEYSVDYVKSDGMGYQVEKERPIAGSTSIAMNDFGRAPADNALQSQEARFKLLPEARFVKRRAGETIHPSYEYWVYELMGSIRRQARIVAE